MAKCLDVYKVYQAQNAIYQKWDHILILTLDAVLSCIFGFILTHNNHHIDSGTTSQCNTHMLDLRSSLAYGANMLRHKSQIWPQRVGAGLKLATA